MVIFNIQFIKFSIDPLIYQGKPINQKTDDELPVMVTLSDDSDNEENERAEYLKNIGYL